MMRRMGWLVAGLSLLAACGASRGHGDDDDDDAVDEIGTGEQTVPDELTGQWQAVLAYVPGYWTGIVPTDDFTGSLGIFFYFQPDGRYQFDLNSALTYFGGNCFRTTRWTESGTVAVDGSAFTFDAAEAINSVMDSCGESTYGNVDPGDPATLTMTPEQDPTGWPMLRMQLPSGEDVLLEKCRDCG